MHPPTGHRWPFEIHTAALEEIPQIELEGVRSREHVESGGGEKVLNRSHSLSLGLAVDPLETVEMSSFNNDRQKPESEEGRLHADKCSVRGGISAQAGIPKKYILP